MENRDLAAYRSFAQQKFIKKNQQLSASTGSPTRRRQGCSSCPARQRKNESVSLNNKVHVKEVQMHMGKFVLGLELLMGMTAMEAMRQT